MSRDRALDRAYLYRADVDRRTTGVRGAIIATLALAGPRVTELCMLNNVDVDLAKARIYIADPKTEAGIRTVDIHPMLLDELGSYRATPTGSIARIHYHPNNYSHIVLFWAAEGWARLNCTPDLGRAMLTV